MTTFHRENKDDGNILNDKTVQMHKQSKRKYEWYTSAANNPDNAHESRFESLPYAQGVPQLNSKHARLASSVDMQRD